MSSNPTYQFFKAHKNPGIQYCSSLVQHDNLLKHGSLFTEQSQIFFINHPTPHHTRIMHSNNPYYVAVCLKSLPHSFNPKKQPTQNSQLMSTVNRHPLPSPYLPSLAPRTSLQPYIFSHQPERALRNSLNSII